jgi:hypothetical protein
VNKYYSSGQIFIYIHIFKRTLPSEEVNRTPGSCLRIIIAFERLELLDQLPDKQEEMRSTQIVVTPVEQAMFTTILELTSLVALSDAISVAWARAWAITIVFLCAAGFVLLILF